MGHIYLMDVATTVCPTIQRAFELLGKKWTSLILHTLLKGPRHYGDLRRTVPDLSDRVLSQRMKELEAEGLVTRRVEADGPVRVSYSLTAKGEALRPVLEGIAAWAYSSESVKPS